jgi:hypothetical protein
MSPEPVMAGASTVAGQPRMTRTPTPPADSPPQRPPRAGGGKAKPRSYRWLRWLIPFAAVLVVVTVTLVAHSMAQPDPGDQAFLNPDSGAAIGGNRLAELLRRDGVTIHRVTKSSDALVEAYHGDATLFIPAPSLMHPYYLRMLKLLPASTRVVLVAPSGLTLSNGLVPADVSGSRWATRPEDPDCGLPEAAQAGRAAIYGLRFLAAEGAVQTAGCYGGALVGVRVHSVEVLLAGASDPFRNDRIGEYHNARLATGLLETHPSLVWLDLHRREAMPGVVHQSAGGGDRAPPSLGDGGSDSDFPIPAQPGEGDDGNGGGAAQNNGGAQGNAPNPLFTAFPLWMWLALGLLALIGLLAEPLPVRVRAAETVVGRGRLYRRARARGPALEVLRGSARQRMLIAFGLEPETAPQVLVAAVANRTGRSTEEVGTILYGDEPDDDKMLVRAVAQLDNLVREVLGGEAT